MKRVLFICLLAVPSVLLFYLVGHDNSGKFDKSTYSLTSPSSIWVIVNKQHPLKPKSYTPNSLVAVDNGQFMQRAAAEQLSKMVAAAKADGTILTLESGYRSFDTQAVAYNSIVNGFGRAKADKESARAGFSEHQTGLAMDFGSGVCNIDDCFASTKAGQWLVANGYKFGFVLRYPSNKTDITGYKYEAWHYRYVGNSLAKQLHEHNDPTLEEYFGVKGGNVYAQ